VHGTQLDRAAIDALAARGATIVACVRSNRWVGAGTPPVREFYASGARVALGTDSLASAPDLNLFAELAALREIAPEIPAARLLESATRSGACALGFGGDLGTIERGKRAALIAVELPAPVADVEEYLVQGVTSDRVRWVHETMAGGA
jgi:cytosine/adenosine deaminase-related metal-dependent hydrolase